MSAIDRLNSIAQTASRRYLTSWQVWVFSSPFLMVGLVFTELVSVRSARDVGLILFVGLVSQLGVGLVVWVASVTLLRPEVRSRASLGKVAFFLVLVGVARGLLIYAGFEVLPAGQEIPWVPRIVTSILLIFVSYLYAAYSFELWREYVAKRAELLKTIAVNEASVDRQGIATNAYRDLVVAGVEEDIQAAKNQTVEVINQISRRIEQGGISTSELDELLKVSDSTWREVSHRTWKAVSPDIPRVSVRELLTTLVTNRPLSLFVLLVGVAFGLTRVLLLQLPVSTALASAAIWLVGVVGLSWLVNRMSSASTRWALLGVPPALVLLVSWPVGVLAAFQAPATVVASVSWVSLAMTVFALAFGLPVALKRSGEVVLGQLEKRVDESALAGLRSQGEMFVLAQKVGAYLHGPLRGQFLQLSMELRAALEKPDPYLIAETLRKLREVVAALGTAAEPPLETTDLRQFLANWGSLIDLTTNIDDVHIPQRVYERVVNVVTEAVNNAIRHGGATKVSVTFSYKPDGLMVEVVGSAVDGKPPGTPGLGEHILNEIAPDAWVQDTTEDGRFRLRVTLKTLG